MTSKGYASLLSAAVAAGLTPNPATRQTVTDKAERDEPAIVDSDDPVMAAAMREARATLPDFLALWAAPKPDTAGFAVKIAVRDGDDAEYFWITPFTNSNGRFAGAINNTPRSVRTVQTGQAITFGQSDIVDWMYMKGGRMMGNHTARALLKSLPRHEAEEFKKRFGLDHDF